MAKYRHVPRSRKSSNWYRNLMRSSAASEAPTSMASFQLPSWAWLRAFAWQLEHCRFKSSSSTCYFYVLVQVTWPLWASVSSPGNGATRRSACSGFWRNGGSSSNVTGRWGQQQGPHGVTPLHIEHHPLLTSTGFITSLLLWLRLTRAFWASPPVFLITHFLTSLPPLKCRYFPVFWPGTSYPLFWSSFLWGFQLCFPPYMPDTFLVGVQGPRGRWASNITCAVSSSELSIPDCLLLTCTLSPITSLPLSPRGRSLEVMTTAPAPGSQVHFQVLLH